MLAKRIIPCLDIKDGQTVKGTNFVNLRHAGDPVELARAYSEQGADELVFLDITATHEARKTVADVVARTAEQVFVPLTVGGGIRTMEDIAFYLDRGVDRVILGSVALKNPELVRQAVDAYGDKIAVGIDAKHGMVATEGWTEDSQMDFIDLAKAMEKMGVATIIYTDIGRDGTLSGPDVQGLDRLNKAVSCNVIASGGVTTITDILVMKDKKMYGTICGKCIYKKTLDLREAVGICK